MVLVSVSLFVSSLLLANLFLLLSNTPV
ncbi:Hypothetical protein EIN_268420, partial [Entamoeba invadens IP1]